MTSETKLVNEVCYGPRLLQLSDLGNHFRRRCILDCRGTCSWLVARRRTLQVRRENTRSSRDKCRVPRYSFHLSNTSLRWDERTRGVLVTNAGFLATVSIYQTHLIESHWATVGDARQYYNNCYAGRVDSEKRNVTLWRPSVCLFVCLSVCLSLRHTYRDIARRQHATRPAYISARHTRSSEKITALYPAGLEAKILASASLMAWRVGLVKDRCNIP